MEYDYSQIENDFKWVKQDYPEVVLRHIAISLKRIADALEIAHAEAIADHHRAMQARVQP